MQAGWERTSRHSLSNGVIVAGTVGNSAQGLASGLLTTAQQIGAALGLAALVAVSTARRGTLTASSGGSLLGCGNNK